MTLSLWLDRAARRVGLMLENINIRESRSGFTVNTSPISKMGGSTKDSKKSSPSQGKIVASGTEAVIAEDMIACSAQDIWRLLTVMQTSVLQQAEEMKNLALKNQALEHRVHMQEEKIQNLQQELSNHRDATRGMLAAQEEMHTYTGGDACHDVGESEAPYAAIVKKGIPKTPSHMPKMYTSEDVTERQEKEKRQMNIVVRGIPEPENEKMLMLNSAITDVIADTFGMNDVVIYGAHRVGKKKDNAHRAIVCTMLDARKRAIILENARIYLKDSPYYICEDRTPTQQKARREAYEARTGKASTSHVEDIPSDT